VVMAAYEHAPSQSARALRSLIRPPIIRRHVKLRHIR
jgi:hypothetical protein